MTFPVKNISISIDQPKDKVYQFASNAANFPQWLAFIKSIAKKSGNTWTAETAMGQIEIKLTPANDFGIIDHVVKSADGSTINNHLRVIKNETGSEVIFTLFKMPGKTEKDFEADAGLVKADLATLKIIVEENKGQD